LNTWLWLVGVVLEQAQVELLILVVEGQVDF
jgi:hypothetical protein